MSSNVRKYVKPKPISHQNQKLIQQHNWKKSSFSPCAASVSVSQISIYVCCDSAILHICCSFFGANDPHILNPQK